MRVLAPVVLILALTAGCGVSSYSSECSGGTCEVAVSSAADGEAEFTITQPG